MKISELIKKLQEYQKEIKDGCSHENYDCDTVDFVLVDSKDFDQSVYYTDVDFTYLEDKVLFNLDYMPGCHCYSGLTLAFRKDKDKDEG